MDLRYLGRGLDSIEARGLGPHTTGLMHAFPPHRLSTVLDAKENRSVE